MADRSEDTAKQDLILDVAEFMAARGWTNVSVRWISEHADPAGAGELTGFVLTLHGSGKSATPTSQYRR